MKAKFYSLGQSVTLFDIREDARCAGVLYVDKRFRSGWWLKVFSVFLIFLSVVCFSFFLGSEIAVKWIYETVSKEGVENTSFKNFSFANLIPFWGVQKPQVSEGPFYPVISGNFVLPLPKEDNFKVYIPKIDVESDVISNVDSGNEKEYREKLKLGVAHAKGSYLPGEGKGPVFLFSHSTDTIFNIASYNAKFYAVKDLTEGDRIILSYRGDDYTYEITEKKIIGPFDLELIRQSKSDLILQTCYPPGTDLLRLLVFAKLVT